MVKIFLWISLVAYCSTSLAATTLEEQIQNQRALVNELSRKLTHNEQGQEFDSLEDLRRQIDDARDYMQSLNDQIISLNRQTSYIAVPTNDAYLTQLQEQIKYELALVQSLVGKIREAEQTNIPSVQLDEMYAEYNQASATLASLQQTYGAAQADQKLAGEIGKANERTINEDRAAQAQHLQQQYQETERAYNQLLQKYEEAQKQTQAHDQQADTLASQYELAKQTLDQLEAMASASNPSE